MTALLVALGGAAGAVLRYLVGRALNARFPWGTFAVNVTGSALLGFLAGTTGATQALLGTGLCGALTTYSTFGYETVGLFTKGHRARAVAYVAATFTAGFGAATLTLLAVS
ncbi:CrcB family protein [Saccharothrix sp. AJ9571]|nr:CrcB family protein [Saccharothrix sp. AJ9571]